MQGKDQNGALKRNIRKEVGKEGLGLRIEEKYQKEGLEEKDQEGGWRRRLGRILRKIIRKEVGGDELARRLEEMNQEGGWMR